jgi:hypothetical protein
MFLAAWPSTWLRDEEAKPGESSDRCQIGPFLDQGAPGGATEKQEYDPFDELAEAMDEFLL